MTTGRAVLVLALLAGCNQILGIGDVQHGAGIDAPPGAADAPPGAIDGAPPVDARFVGPVAFAAASDFQHPGMGGALDLGTGAVVMNAAPGAVGRDPVVRFTGAYFVIVNRYGDNGIVLLDGHSLAVAKTIATGAGTNPQDAAITNGKVFVPTLGSAGVQVYDLAGGTQPRLIDLSSFDVDGQPDCVSAYATPTHVFVACDLLDASFKPRGPGKIAVIDPASETMTASFDLPYANPFGFLEPTVGGGIGGELLIDTVPSFTDVTTGCVARIKITGAPAANGCLVTNQVLGGYAGTLAVNATGDHVYAAVSGGSLKEIAYPGGGVTPLVPPAGDAYTNVASCSTGDVVATMTTSGGTGGFQVFRNGAPLYAQPASFGISPQNASALACD